MNTNEVTELLQHLDTLRRRAESVRNWLLGRDNAAWIEYLDAVDDLNHRVPGWRVIVRQGRHVLVPDQDLGGE